MITGSYRTSLPQLLSLQLPVSIFCLLPFSCILLLFTNVVNLRLVEINLKNLNLKHSVITAKKKTALEINVPVVEISYLG